MDDVDAWMEFMLNPEATKFLALKTHDRQSCELWIQRMLERYENNNGVCAVIEKNSGELIGQCGIIFQEVDGMNEIEVGYHFITRFWGKGFATEAAIACRDSAFRNNITDTVVSLIDKNNFRSQKVARRNGMKPTKSTQWKGIDIVVWRIDKSEWEKIKS
jgi:RimJ/RimL family protein N-acetyltransferase